MSRFKRPSFKRPGVKDPDSQRPRPFPSGMSVLVVGRSSRSSTEPIVLLRQRRDLIGTLLSSFRTP